MRINWFPGHMNKARREIREALARTDGVIEVLDARAPRSSRNPMLERLVHRVPVLTVLAKSDLADPEVTRAWVEGYNANRRHCMAIDAGKKTDAGKVLAACKKIALPRSRPGRPTYLMVVGIPNVGKSTLLNGLAGRKIAAVEDRPAVTQRQQLVEAKGDREVVISDTPGVLWPRLEDQEGAVRLALSGAIKESVIEIEAVACYGLGLLALYYPERVAERYELDVSAWRGDGAERSEVASAFDVVGAFERRHGFDTYGMLRFLGEKRGCLLKGSEVDLQKAARILVNDVQSGKLGQVSFDRPNEEPLELPEAPRVLRNPKEVLSEADGPKERPAKFGSARGSKAPFGASRAGTGRGSRSAVPRAAGQLAKPRSSASAIKADGSAGSPKPSKKAAKPKLSLKKRARG